MALSRTVPRRPTPPTLVNFVVIYILFIIIVGMRERRSIHIPTNVTIYLKKKKLVFITSIIPRIRYIPRNLVEESIERRFEYRSTHLAFYYNNYR